MSVKLPNNNTEGSVAYGSFTTAAFGFSIPSNAVPEAKASFRNTGTTGNWYIKFARSTGPTTSVYAKKIGPGEGWTNNEPALGDVWFLADSGAGNLDYYAEWAT